MIKLVINIFLILLNHLKIHKWTKLDKQVYNHYYLKIYLLYYLIYQFLNQLNAHHSLISETH